MPSTDIEHVNAVPAQAQGARARARILAWAPVVMPYALAVIALLVFLPSLWNDFVEWDDHINLLENKHYRGLGWTHIRWMFTSALMGHYIPVTWLTFGLDYTLGGMNPFGYHLTNVLVHAASTALFYLVALRLLAKGSRLDGGALQAAAVMATLFFSVHPLRAESVAWVTERRDVLSVFFFLVTMLFYLKAANGEGSRRRLLAVSLVAYVLSLLSKSIVMTLPFILLLIDVYPLGRLQVRWGAWRDRAMRAVLMEKLPYLALGVAGGAVSYWAVASQDLLTSSAKYSWFSRIGIATYSVWFYVEKTFLPVALAPMYELPRVVRLTDPQFFWPLLAVVAITVSVLALHRIWPAGLAVWLYYGIVIGPVAGVIHSGHQITNDRYSYLSCLGIALLVGAAVGKLGAASAANQLRPSIVRAAALAAAAWVLALGTLTWYQVQTWRDTQTLWLHAVEVDPSCSICQNNVGYFMYKEKLLPQAKERYELALSLRPDRLRVHGNLGLVLHSMGDVDGALRHIQISLDDSPRDTKNLTSMGYVLLTQRRHAEALPYLARAYAIDPNYVPMLVNLGLGLSETGQTGAGLAHLKRALALRPEESMVHLGLARIHLARGEYVEATREYEALMPLDPRAAKALEPVLFAWW